MWRCRIESSISPSISPTSPETEYICQWHNGPAWRRSRSRLCPKFRTVGGVGNRRRRGRNSGNGDGMETADGEVDLGSVVEKALRTAPAVLREGSLFLPSLPPRTSESVRGGWGGEGGGRMDGAERADRTQTRDLVTGVIVNGVNCHLARQSARNGLPNVFIHHDRRGSTHLVYLV